MSAFLLAVGMGIHALIPLSLVPSQETEKKQAESPPRAESPPTADPKPKANPQPKPTPEQKAATEKKEHASDAEQLIRLQKILEYDTKSLGKIKAELDDPKGEHHQAEDALKKLDVALAQKHAELQKLKSKEPNTPTTKLQEEIGTLEKQHDLARDRLNVAIKEHKILEDRTALLQVKIGKTRHAIELLQGGARPPGKTAEPAAHDKAPSKAETPASTQEPSAPTANAELVKARKQAQAKDAEAKQAQDKIKSIDERILFLNKSLDLDKRTLEVFQTKALNAAQIQANLQKDLEKQRAAKVPESELALLRSRLGDADKLVAATRKEIDETSDHKKDVETELKKLQADKVVAEEQAERKAKEAQTALDQVKFLESPLAPQNLILWGWHHIPPIVVIIAAIVLLHWLVRVTGKRIVKWMLAHQVRGGTKDRENRAETLVGVFRNTASFLVLTSGCLMILQALGIPIMPVLGGAAAGGLAIAFGAQNLIKDYLSGYMLLLDDEYGVNDVVKIGGLSGQVESINLRRTVLRDSEGTVHFVPHGTITTVSNMTHRWARAFFELRIAYKEDVDRVMEVLLELCKQLRDDPAFGPFILDDAEMLGVDHLSENGIAIQFQMRTSPLKQWTIKRELLRRIKRRFDELGIEFPHYEFGYVMRSSFPGNGQLAEVGAGSDKKAEQ